MLFEQYKHVLLHVVSILNRVCSPCEQTQLLVKIRNRAGRIWTCDNPVSACMLDRLSNTYYEWTSTASPSAKPTSLCWLGSSTKLSYRPTKHFKRRNWIYVLRIKFQCIALIFYFRFLKILCPCRIDTEIQPLEVRMLPANSSLLWHGIPHCLIHQRPSVQD